MLCVTLSACTAKQQLSLSTVVCFNVATVANTMQCTLTLLYTKLALLYNNIILHAMQSREVPDSAGAWYCCLQIGWVWSSLCTHAAVFSMLIVVSRHVGMSEQLGLAEKASIITQ